MSKDVTLKLTTDQARGLYRLIYDYGHWESKLFFSVQNNLIDALEVDEGAIEEDREEKDKGVSKLFTLYRQGGPQALAEALKLGPPEAIQVEALAWQDLEAIWYHVSATKQPSKQGDQAAAKQLEQETLHQSFTIASVCRADLRDILTDEEITTLSDDDMADITDRMSDAYRDNGGYWESLEIMARFVLKRKEESIE